MTKRAHDNNGVEIDLFHILALLWNKVWLILLCALLVGVLFFGYAKYTAKDLYFSTTTMYVNNSSNTTQSSINSSDLITARSLVSRYIGIMKSRTTLTEVAKLAEVNYTYGQLLGMISAGPVDETEIFSITVTAGDPEVANKIANTIVVVLKKRVEDIYEGSTLKVVDEPYPSGHVISPNSVKYATSGFAVGAAIVCAVLIIIDMLDDVIRDDTYIMQTYDIPILARVPDMLAEGSDHYGYNRSYGRNRGNRESN